MNDHLGHRLSGYVDGELPAAAQQLVVAHLAACPGCRVEARRHSRTKGDLRGLGEPAPSVGLLTSLLDLPAAPHGSLVGAGKGFDGFPVAAVGRRAREQAAPLLAAGIAGFAALSLASTVFTGASAPRPARATVGGGGAQVAPAVFGGSLTDPMPIPSSVWDDFPSPTTLRWLRPVPVRFLRAH